MTGKTEVDVYGCIPTGNNGFLTCVQGGLGSLIGR